MFRQHTNILAARSAATGLLARALTNAAPDAGALLGGAGIQINNAQQQMLGKR